ncbi:MAG: hypothetical protein OH316_02470, partial [Candidatus Parvarchaeota archaeon]|nr:hypothetical protein [Candidatus Parvarchaeota archaeon]
AIFIVVAFVGSIFFFIPRQSNSNLFSEYILVPSSLVSNQTEFSPYNSNLTAIGFVSPGPISSLVINGNFTTLASVTSGILSSSRLNYTMSNSTLCIFGGTSFTQNLCDNSNYTWVMLQNVSGSLQVLSKPLSSVELDSLSYPSNYFYLIYEPVQSAAPSGSLPNI